jgi:hypothetical protein
MAAFREQAARVENVIRKSQLKFSKVRVNLFG